MILPNRSNRLAAELEAEFNERVELMPDEKIIFTDQVFTLRRGPAYFVLTNQSMYFIVKKILNKNSIIKIQNSNVKSLKLKKSRRFQQITVMKNSRIDISYKDNESNLKSISFWKIMYFLTIFMPDNHKTQYIYNLIEDHIRPITCQ